MIHNRPGLDALDYRIGTHGTLLRAMLRRIADWTPPEDQSERPLADLTTRMPDDPAIALLDAWAVAGDVLSFYQERIANEGYLRTATERRSVLELARAIGYELNPGVAASTHLVWEVEKSFAIAGQTPPNMAPPPRQVVVAGGTRVQSLPGQNELPQTFETSADLIAHADFNELRPRLTVPQQVSLGSTELFIEGIATGFARGDRVLITAPPHGPGDGSDPRDAVDISYLEITDAVPEPDRARTRLSLKAIPKQPPPSQPPLPTLETITPDEPFKPPEPPVDPPVEPAEMLPPVYVLMPRPLTAQEIEQRLRDFTWRNAQFAAQLALLAWNPFAVIDFLARNRVVLDLSPVFEWVPIVPARDVKRPRVVSVFPPDHSEAGEKTVVVVRFSEPMDKASAEQSVTLRKVGASDDVPADVEYIEATGAVHLTPTPPLTAGSVSAAYVITVDDTKAMDKAGNLLAAKVTSNFDILDRTRPKLIEKTDESPEPLEPVPNAPEVAVDAVVTARFDEDLDNVTADTFFLRDGTGTRVAADRVPSDDGRTITLKPHAPLARSMRYTATLTSGITDTVEEVPAGEVEPKPNHIFPVEWSFATVARDSVAPEAKLAVYGFREQTAFFGHNAPRWASLPKPSKESKRDGDPWEYSWDDPPRSIWVDSQGSSLGGDTVLLDREVPDIEAGSWAAFETATGAAVYFVTNASARSVADYAMSGRASRLVLSKRNGRSPCEGPGAPADFRVRETVAHVRSEPLTLVELPIEDKLEEGDTEIVLNGMVLGLDRGRLVALRGELDDLRGMIGDEIVQVKDSFHTRGFTTLVLEDPGLTRSYVRKTVTMNANVVRATHGETVAREILGGGDGARANQSFTLRRPPLTYVPDLTPSGARSTLEIRVDGVRWDEAPVLYGLGPRSRSYIVRRSDDNVASVVFGDGERGARPPTGAENIVAAYRTGIGLAGLVGAGRLTLLRERPLGIASVNNPLPSAGAAEPESREDAKVNAPLTVLTMERIVSLRDFEDFARGFAGIDKAQSIAIWEGDQHRVVVTVAGTSLPPLGNLVAAIDGASEPGLDVTVCPYRLRFFDLEAAVRVDPAYRVQDVLDAARAAVLAAFSFERRAFAQPVTDAEVVEVMQLAPGVVAVYLGALYPLVGEEVKVEEGVQHPLESVIPANPAERVEGKFVGAELFLVNPAGVTITERTA